MPQEARPDERLTEIADTIRGVVDALNVLGFVETSKELQRLANEIDEQVNRWREELSPPPQQPPKTLPPLCSDAQAPSGDATEPPEEAQARRQGDVRGGNL